LETLELEGVGTFRQRTAIRLGQPLTAICGPNKAGKTTMVEAIAWALLGGPHKGLVSRGMAHAEVEVVFAVPSGRYKIRRQVNTKGAARAWMWRWDGQGWDPVGEKLVRASDAALAGVLGMDAKMAQATWLSRQEDTNALLHADPSGLRTLLAKASGLDVYAQLAEAAKDRLAQAGPQAAKTAGAAQALAARLESLGADDRTAQQVAGALEQARTRAAALRDDLRSDPAARLSRLRADHESAAGLWRREKAFAAQVADDARQALDEAQDRLERAVQAASDMDALASRAADARAASDAASDAAREAAQAVAGLRSKVIALHNEIAQARARLADQEHLEGSPCPVCLRDLDASSAAAVVSAAIASLARLQSAYRQAEGRARAAQEADGRARDAARRAASEADVAGREADLAEQAGKAVPGLRDAEVLCRQNLTSAMRRESDVDARKPVLDAAAVRELKNRLSDGHMARLRAELAQAEQEELALSTALARAAERESLSAEVERARAAADEAAADAEGWRMLKDAFSPGGIPAMILPAVCQEVADEANMVLGEMGDDGLAVSLRMSGKDEAELSAVVAGSTAPISSLSGSEKIRVSLALRAGLCRCVSKRTGTPVNTMVVDEGFGSFDKEFLASVAGALAGLARSGTDVLLVTHQDELRDAMPAHIWVQPGFGGSAVSC